MADAEAALQFVQAAQDALERLADPLNLLGAHALQSTSRHSVRAMRFLCNFRR